MKRRDFLRSILGAMGAVAVGPAALELARKIAPVEAGFEASFVIAPQEIYDWMVPPTAEMVDALVARTAWYWNDLALKNLTQGVKDGFCIND